MSESPGTGFAPPASTARADAPGGGPGTGRPPLRVAVVDYGAGNLRSVGGALDVLGASWFLARAPADLEHAGALVLPGVGSAGSAMRELDRRGLAGGLRDAEVPVLGICLGLQLLFESSEEEGGVRCLGLLPGSARRLSGTPRLPHMGWNRVRPVRPHPLLDGLDPDGDWFYFAHSFGCLCPEDITLGVTSYGPDFVSAAGSGNIWGVQFHPEKSGASGLRVIANFLEGAARASRPGPSAAAASGPAADVRAHR